MEVVDSALPPKDRSLTPSTLVYVPYRTALHIKKALDGTVYEPLNTQQQALSLPRTDEARFGSERLSTARVYLLNRASVVGIVRCSRYMAKFCESVPTVVNPCQLASASTGLTDTPPKAFDWSIQRRHPCVNRPVLG